MMATKDQTYYAQSLAKLSADAPYVNVVLYPVSKEQLAEIKDVDRQIPIAAKEAAKNMREACSAVVSLIRKNEKIDAKITFVDGKPEINYKKSALVDLGVRKFYDDELAARSKNFNAFPLALDNTKSEFFTSIRNKAVFQAEPKFAAKIDGQAISQAELNDLIQKGRLRSDKVLTA